jgi:hypothetical protein
VQRGALIGAMIAGVAGLAWSLWAAGGASGAAAVAIRVVGIALGLALVVAAGLRMRGAAPDGGGSLFRSRGYLLTAVAEVIALFGGGALLNLTGNGQYVIAWYAFVVGVHFLVFGRLFHARFHGLGIAMVVAAAAGAVAGLAGGGPAPILLISGLLSAAALFVVGALAVRSPAGRDRRDGGGTAGGGSAA